MKYFFITIVIALAALAYYTFYYKPLKADSPTLVSALQLGELPAQNCPDKAWLLATEINSNKPIIDRVVPVRDCRTILLRNYLPSMTGEFNIYVKVPRALVASATVSTPLLQSISLPIQLGDVTNDNAIDEKDEKFVVDNLYTEGGIADLNGDDQVSVEDVVLVRLNKGVGVERVDKKPWSQVR